MYAHAWGDDQYAVTAAASGAQIKQLSKDAEPADVNAHKAPMNSDMLPWVRQLMRKRCNAEVSVVSQLKMADDIVSKDDIFAGSVHRNSTASECANGDNCRVMRRAQEEVCCKLESTPDLTTQRFSSEISFRPRLLGVF